MSQVKLSDAIRFYSNTTDIHYPGSIAFSNFYPSPITVDDVQYTTTEAYFQQYKFGEGDKNFICSLDSPGAAASFGRCRLVLKQKHLDIIDDLRRRNEAIPLMQDGREYRIKDRAQPKRIMTAEEWEFQKIVVMYTALRAKFTQHHDLYFRLVNTKDKWLIEHTKNDLQWGDGETGAGKNYLGKLLMILRADICDSVTWKPVSINDFTEKSFDREYLATPMNQLLDYSR